ncbi:hypothetical protein TNCV_3491931 [Trichonephila clavipes]|nr:hypothetical protein TNCV_3491931 [Trichonephila clavipes]
MIELGTLQQKCHLCPEAITGLCSNPLHYSPTSESVDRRTNNIVVIDFPEVINSIVVVKIPNPIDISLVWVPF